MEPEVQYPANNSSPLVLTVSYLTVAKQYISVSPSKQQGGTIYKEISSATLRENYQDLYLVKLGKLPFTNTVTLK